MTAVDDRFRSTMFGRQAGPFNPADLDADGAFNVDKFFARIRAKDREWYEKHFPWGNRRKPKEAKP